MAVETYEVVQVSGGKMHRPAQTTQPRAAWGHPMPTACGRTVTPCNVFATVAEAVRYCGGRVTAMCQQCPRETP